MSVVRVRLRGPIAALAVCALAHASPAWSQAARALDAATTTPALDTATRAPAPDAATVAPPVGASSPSTLRDACRRGDVASCDAIVEYWGPREIAPAGLAARARDDLVALREACDTRSVASACGAAALMLRYGTAGPRDTAASGRYFARLRELGDLFGFRGQPPSPAGDAARARQQTECASGRSRACAVSGWAAFTGVTQAADSQAAFAAWTRGCDLGHGTSCRWAGHLAYTHPEVGGTRHAERQLRRACLDLGNPGGCDELGLYLDASTATRPSARAMFERACDAGSRSGCLHAGQRREAALPGASPAMATAARRDAMTRFARACAAQETDACSALTRLAASPPGCRFDPRESLETYRARCATSPDDVACSVVAACEPRVRPASAPTPAP